LQSWGEHFVDRGGWAVGPEGNIYLARERNRYAISVHAPDGSPLRVIEREYRPHRRSDAEKQEIRDGLSMSIDGRRVEVTAEIEDHDPCVAGLLVVEDGTLWVRHGNSGYDQPEGVLLTYDLFGPDGGFGEQVRIACPGDLERDRLYLINPGCFVLLRNIAAAYAAMFGGGQEEQGEAEPLEVVCLRPGG